MEEVCSVKYSVTFGLPDRRLMGEVDGFGGQLVVQNAEQTRVYVVVEDTEEEKMALSASKSEENRKLWMYPIIETSWKKSKEYSIPMEDTISLVGKFVEMPGATSGDFAPQTARVGQMKLEAPLEYSGKRHLVV